MSLFSLSLRSGLSTCLLLMSANLFAANTIYEVVDQNGSPLSNAVLVNTVTPVSNIEPVVAIMDQVNKRFVPSVIAIRQGRSVSFPNSDNTRHHVYSFSKPKRFTIKLYANKPKDPIEFDKPGLVVVGCNIHDKMVGYIFVSEWDEFAISDEYGQVTFAQSLSLPMVLKIWHPDIKTPNKLMDIVDTEQTQEGKTRIVLEVANPGST